MSLRSFDLTTVSNVKSYLDITVTTHDSLIEILIKSATDFIENYCDRRFIETSYSNEEYDGSGSRYLLLKQYPVNSSETFTLQENRASDNSDDWDTIDAEDYFVDYDAGIINLVGHFSKAPKKYRVSYTSGYDRTADTWPMDIEYACLQLVSLLWNKRKAGGLKSEGFGDFNVSFQLGIEQNPDIKNVLDKYKREMPSTLYQ